LALQLHVEHRQPLPRTSLFDNIFKKILS
jgi:hypothetical protein